MAIPILHLAASGREPGPFAANKTGRKLRLLLDLPAAARQPDTSTTSWSEAGVPDPAHFLWSLGLRDDIEVFWLADESEQGVGALHFDPVHDAEDQLPFTVTHADGSTLYAVWPYRQWQFMAEREARDDESRAALLHQVLIARVAVELGTDLLVTNNEQLLASIGNWITSANPVSVADALAAMGLYLRNRSEFPIIAPAMISMGEHLLLWTAVRSQLPAGWAWGNALVQHGTATDNDSPILLFGSTHERLVRVLRYRDDLHLALLEPQNNSTADRATEALDNLLVNMVGSFDAAARVAHLVVGIDPKRRHKAGWQNRDWRQKISIGAPALADLFDQGTSGDLLFGACRLLRNTVHGEALQSTGMQSGGQPRRTLVRLPHDDATDLIGIFDALGGSTGWGVSVDPLHSYVEPRVLVERLLPAAFALLDQAMELTPVSQLTGLSTPLQGSPPSDTTFGLGTRVRACLLLGLIVPAV